MAKQKKRKIHIKKKNFAIFLIVLFLVLYAVVQLCFLTFKVITSFHHEKKGTPTPTASTNPSPSVSPSASTNPSPSATTHTGIEELDYIDQKLDYFNYEYLDRYLNYKKKNPSLSPEDVVMDVNIGLDYDYYTHTSPATNVDSNLVLVNKYHSLSDSYVPSDLKSISSHYALEDMKLRYEAKIAFENMAKDASKEDLDIIAMSSYRSYRYQINLYNRYKKQDGEEAADTYSGRPGFSEHQTGLAVDVYNGTVTYTNFHKTKEFKWMQDHAHEYGFILRFPKDKEKRTGYVYESWHYRYVGLRDAEIIHNENLCLEEYYVKYVEQKKD